MECEVMGGKVWRQGPTRSGQNFNPLIALMNANFNAETQRGAEVLPARGCYPQGAMAKSGWQKYNRRESFLSFEGQAV